MPSLTSTKRERHSLKQTVRIPEGTTSGFWQKSDLSTARFDSYGESERSAQDDKAS